MMIVGTLAGTVTDVDEARGLGTVTTDDGSTYLFHVVEIVDGSRTVDVGQPVSFRPLPRFGEMQAGRLQKV